MSSIMGLNRAELLELSAIETEKLLYFTTVYSLASTFLTTEFITKKQVNRCIAEIKGLSRIRTPVRKAETITTELKRSFPNACMTLLKSAYIDGSKPY